MFKWLMRFKNRNVCALCKKKTKEPRKYWNDKNEPISVCPLCVPYAERRLYRKR